MFKTILVPTDGSDLSTSAVVKAVEFAKETGAQLSFLYVTPKHKGYLLGEGALDTHIPPESFAEAMAHQGDAVLAQATASARAAGVTSQQLAEAADAPHEAIISVAMRLGCDLIIMASHGRKGVSALLLGSETTKVLTHSKIPVLVMR